MRQVFNVCCMNCNREWKTDKPTQPNMRCGVCDLVLALCDQCRKEILATHKYRCLLNSIQGDCHAVDSGLGEKPGGNAEQRSNETGKLAGGEWTQQNFGFK